MSYFYIYEWRQVGWAAAGGWKKPAEACSYVMHGTDAAWFAIYSSNPVQLVGSTVLTQPQAYGAMCAGTVMPTGLAVPGWTSSPLMASTPPPSPPPSPAPTVPPPPPPPPPPSGAVLLLVGAAVVVGGVLVWMWRRP